MHPQPPAFCDPQTGLCNPAPLDGPKANVEWREDAEIIYIGDPMCSWCWGISPQLNQLERQARMKGIPYRIVVGGLRPGGGDPWNQEFKNFLKHHWEEVTARSGQPFGFDLFELETFNYDTEPSCRAVVAARTLNPEIEGRFFELTQHFFYVQNEDPTQLEFYKPICQQLKLDFEQFSVLFQSPAIKEVTRAEFQLNRQWGIRGYPTVVLRQGDKLHVIARGFSTFDDMWAATQEVLKQATN